MLVPPQSKFHHLEKKRGSILLQSKEVSSDYSLHCELFSPEIVFPPTVVETTFLWVNSPIVVGYIHMFAG